MSAGSAEDVPFDQTDAELPPQVYSQGPGTLSVDRGKFHGSTRARALNLMHERGHREGVILLKGGGAFHIYDTDMEAIFRQESFFFYLFGVEEEDYYGALNLATGETTLFMPRLPSSYAIWLGAIQGPVAKKSKFGVDHICYVDDMSAIISKWAPPKIFILDGINTDSGRQSLTATFPEMESHNIDRESLYPVLAESRSIKTEEELKVMKYANQVASAAHVELMRKCRPGLMEYALESIFKNICYLEGGCRRIPYTPICASGPNGAILHYGHGTSPNNRQVDNGDLLLLDLGCEYYCYGSDITCTFPADGRFTSEQRLVYEAVLAAHTAVLKTMKPGLKWTDMHLLAEREILSKLKAGGLLKGSVDEMVDYRIGALFMPHGLGHLLGMETHDVGGYIEGLHPQRSDLPGLKSLRTARVLEEGMVITVEPGCYFNPFLLNPAFNNPAQAKYLIKSRLQTFMSFGGVRIEDDVIVTKDGAESMTDVPRTVDDIEQVMAGKSWP